MDKQVINLLSAVGVAGALYLGFGAFAGAQIASGPEAQVKEREQTMKSLGASMATTAKFIKGEGGSAEDVLKAAMTIVEVGKRDPAAVFPEGTGVGVGESEAKPEIWQNFGEVTKRWQALEPAGVKLAEVAPSGDKAAIGQAMQALGRTCSNCHEDFRVKKN